MRKFAYALILAVCNAQNYFQVVSDGVASQSSTYSQMFANKAVDNNHNSHSRTRENENDRLPWWRYQFPSQTLIRSVFVHGSHINTQSSQLLIKTLRIAVSGFSSAPSVNPSGLTRCSDGDLQIQELGWFNCNASGLYLYLYQTTDDFVLLSEVRAFTAVLYDSKSKVQVAMSSIHSGSSPLKCLSWTHKPFSATLNDKLRKYSSVVQDNSVQSIEFSLHSPEQIDFVFVEFGLMSTSDIAQTSIKVYNSSDVIICENQAPLSMINVIDCVVNGSSALQYEPTAKISVRGPNLVISSFAILNEPYVCAKPRGQLNSVFAATVSGSTVTIPNPSFYTDRTKCAQILVVRKNGIVQYRGFEAGQQQQNTFTDLPSGTYTFQWFYENSHLIRSVEQTFVVGSQTPCAQDLAQITQATVTVTGFLATIVIPQTSCLKRILVWDQSEVDGIDQALDLALTNVVINLPRAGRFYFYFYADSKAEKTQSWFFDVTDCSKTILSDLVEPTVTYDQLTVTIPIISNSLNCPLLTMIESDEWSEQGQTDQTIFELPSVRSYSYYFVVEGQDGVESKKWLLDQCKMASFGITDKVIVNQLQVTIPDPEDNLQVTGSCSKVFHLFFEDGVTQVPQNKYTKQAEKLTLTAPGTYKYRFSFASAPTTQSALWSFTIVPCSFDELKSLSPEAIVDGAVATLPWFLDTDMCKKQLSLFDQSGATVSDYTFSAPQLTIKNPGSYSYHYWMKDYPDVISETLNFAIDPCFMTTFLDETYSSSNLQINGLAVILPKIADFWGEHQNYKNPDLCEKKLHIKNSLGVEISDFMYKSPELLLPYGGAFTYFFSLEKYPSIVSKTYELVIPTLGCTLSTSQLQDVTYLIGSVNAQKFTQVADVTCVGGCQSSDLVQYAIEIVPAASFIFVSEDKRTIVWDSATLVNAGEYTIRARGYIKDRDAQKCFVNNQFKLTVLAPAVIGLDNVAKDFQSIDKDGSGKLSLAQLVAFYENQYPGQAVMDMLVLLLGENDEDEDQWLSRAEVTKSEEVSIDAKYTMQAQQQFPGIKVKPWAPPTNQDEKKQKVSFISYVSAFGRGEFTLKLSEPIILPNDYKQFLSSNKTRSLADATALNRYGLDDSAISLKFIANQEDKSIYEGSTYQFVNITGDELSFKLEYPQQTKVSKGKTKDMLVVTIEKPYMFVGAVTNQILFQKSQRFESEIPLQHPSELSLKISQSIASGVQTTSIGVVIGTLIAQLAGKSVIKRLWSAFLAIQLLLLTYVQHKIKYPANASLIYDSIKGVLEMNALPKDQILDFIFKGTKDKLVPQDGLVLRMGIFGAALALITLFIVVAFGLRYAVKRGKAPKLEKQINKLINKVCWNMVIKTFQGGFLGYVVAAMITLKGSQSIVDTSISSAILVCLVAAVGMNYHYLKRQPAYTLASQETKARVGALYSELNVFSKTALLYSTIFYLSRFVAAFLLTGFWGITFHLQMAGMVLLFLIETTFVQQVRPYMVRHEWRTGQQQLELLNHFALYAIFIMKFAFTGFFEPEQEYVLGWVYAGLFVIFLMANVLQLLPLAYNGVKSYLHKKKCDQINRKNQVIREQNLKIQQFNASIKEQKERKRKIERQQRKELKKIRKIQRRMLKNGELKQIDEISSIYENSEQSVRGLPQPDQIHKSESDQQDSQPEINASLPQTKLPDLQGCKSYFELAVRNHEKIMQSQPPKEQLILIEAKPQKKLENPRLKAIQQRQQLMIAELQELEKQRVFLPVKPREIVIIPATKNTASKLWDMSPPNLYQVRESESL